MSVGHVCNVCEQEIGDGGAGRCGCPPEPDSIVRVGFDVGGVLSKYPEILVPIVAALAASQRVEVHVLSDMHPLAKILDMLGRNGIDVPAERVHSCDYATHGETCKAVKAREIGLDVLLDDFPGYVATPGAPALRLLAMPDPERPYYADDWKTDGSEGDFGRRRKA
jgi:hypothetical protein